MMKVISIQNPFGGECRDFTIGLLPNTEARLSMSYVDLNYNSEKNVDVMNIPPIDIEVLRKGSSNMVVTLDRNLVEIL